MNNVLKSFLVVLLLLQLVLIISTVKRKKLSMRYACFWIVLIIFMIFIALFPNIIFKLADTFGFEASSNMIFLLGFFFLFYVIFILTTSLSIQNAKITLLIQEVSLLKERVNKNGKKD